MHRHSDDYELYVALLWEDVLGRDDIGPHEDFFAMGGTGAAATAVLDAIRAEFGAVVSPEAFRSNPTGAALAHEVRRHLRARGPRPTPMRMPPWADGGTPIIFVHGPAGELLFLQNYRPSQLGRPVVGLRGPGVDLEEDPPTTVDALAERHVRDLLAAGIEGPVAFAGTCMGALVTLAVAQRFMAEGHEVAFLGLVEPPAVVDDCVAEPEDELIDEQLTYLCLMADVDVPAEVDTATVFRALQQAGELPAGHTLELFERKLAVYTSIVRACYEYRIDGRYDGPTVLYQSRETQTGGDASGLLSDAEPDWWYERFWREHLPPDTLVRRQKCTHLGLIHRRQTRELLQQDLERALSNVY